MNELTEFGPENNALGRRWGAQTPLVFTMASDAFPVIDAGFREMDEELLALRGDAMRAGADASASAVVGEFSAVGLANPLESGVIAVCEVVMVRPTASAPYTLRRQGLAVSAFQGSTLGFAYDSRQEERASVRLIASNQPAASDFGSTLFSRTANNGALGTDDLLVPFVLAPSSTLWVVAATANQAITVAFRWRQRRLTSWEARGVGS